MIRDRREGHESGQGKGLISWTESARGFSPDQKKAPEVEVRPLDHSLESSSSPQECLKNHAGLPRKRREKRLTLFEAFKKATIGFINVTHWFLRLLPSAAHFAEL